MLVLFSTGNTFEYVELYRKYAVFTFSILDQKKPFWANLVKKINCQFKLKFDTKTNLNMWNSMMMFTFSVFDHKYLSWANLIQKLFAQSEI